MGTCSQEGCEVEAKECGHCENHCDCKKEEAPATEAPAAEASPAAEAPAEGKTAE